MRLAALPVTTFTVVTRPTTANDVYSTQAASTGNVLRSYDMTDIDFASIRYSGLAEELSFSVSSMSWAAGADEAEVAPDPDPAPAP